MKLTAYGRMRRRIKRELASARAERAIAIIQTRAMMSAALVEISAIRSTVIDAKLAAAMAKGRPDGYKIDEEILKRINR